MRNLIKINFFSFPKMIYYTSRRFAKEIEIIKILKI